MAWVAYVLLAFALIYYFYKRQRERFNEEQRRVQYQHQLEIEKNEKEIISLKNIKLEAEVQHNEAQLASNTMNLLQKRELLNRSKRRSSLHRKSWNPIAGQKTPGAS